MFTVKGSKGRWERLDNELAFQCKDCGTYRQAPDSLKIIEGSLKCICDNVPNKEEHDG